MIQRTFKADNKDEIEKIAAEIKAEPLYDRCRDRLIIIGRKSGMKTVWRIIPAGLLPCSMTAMLWG